MKCGKVKNPCKICFQSVSNKNGLQCKGACKKWAHFKCLNYTPGKISDIKAGLIKITCPCPNCTPSEQKEVLTNPPYTCKNQECPATKIPSCESIDCPSKQKPIPPFHSATLNRPDSPKLKECLPPLPLTPPKCTTQPRKSNQCLSPPQTPPKCPTPPAICPSPPRKALPQRCASPPRRPTSPPRRAHSPPRRQLPPPRRQASPPPRRASPPCSADCPKKTLQKLTADGPCTPQRSLSCSFKSASSHSGKSRVGLPRTCSSDSAIPSAEDQKVIFNAIEEMCCTVGQLSSQLKCLMCTIMNTFEKMKKNRN